MGDKTGEKYHLVPTRIRLATSVLNGGATYIRTRVIEVTNQTHHLVAASSAVVKQRGQDGNWRFGALSLILAFGFGAGRETL